MSLQKGRPQDSSSGSGPNCGWEFRLRIGGTEPSAALLGVVEVCVDPLLTISWLACKSLARGFSASLVLENDTIKLTPSLDFKEIVGLTSSPNKHFD